LYRVTIILKNITREGIAATNLGSGKIQLDQTPFYLVEFVIQIAGDYLSIRGIG
jgi:hypothetical protein